MSFRDIIKSSFFEAYAASTFGVREIIFRLSVTAAIAIYIFFLLSTDDKKDILFQDL